MYCACLNGTDYLWLVCIITQLVFLIFWFNKIPKNYLKEKEQISLSFMLYEMKDVWFDNKKWSPIQWERNLETTFLISQTYTSWHWLGIRKNILIFLKSFRIKPTCLVFQERKNISSSYTNKQQNFKKYKEQGCEKFVTLSYSDRVQDDTTM